MQAGFLYNYFLIIILSLIIIFSLVNCFDMNDISAYIFVVLTMVSFFVEIEKEYKDEA
jgi:hypothetical protein